MNTDTRPTSPRLVVLEHGAAIHRIDGLVRMIPRPVASSAAVTVDGRPPISIDIHAPPPGNGPPAA